MANDAERETLSFSPMKPITLVTLVIAGYIGFGYYVDSYGNFKQWFTARDWFILSVLVLVIMVALIKPLRVTALILMLRPAVVLTNEYIKITYTGYTIYWKDVKDVYLAHTGSADRGTVGKVFIVIVVRDPEKYLAQINNGIDRWYQHVIVRLRPSPFEIDLSLIRGDEDDNFNTVLKYYQNNRGF